MLNFDYRGAAATPGLPLTPVWTEPVVTGLRLLPLPGTQSARLSPAPVSSGGLALPGPPPHSPATGPAAGAPPRPPRPAPVAGVCRAHPLLLVAVHAGTGAGVLRYVVHRTAPDVAAGAVVADQEVLEISLQRGLVTLD